MIVSERAKLQIKKNAKYLVVLVDAGGCKGFSYEYFYSNNGDGYLVLDDVILTDQYSLSFLYDSFIDFISEIGFEDFEIRLSNYSHCGCGKSFI